MRRESILAALDPNTPLPAVQSSSFNEEVPAVQDPFPAAQFPVDLETDETTIKAINLKTMQYTFRRIGGAWDQASTIDEVCKLALVTSKMLKERMDFLRMPYGHRDSKEKDTFAVPID